MARNILAIAVTGTALLAGGLALGVEPAAADTKLYHWRTDDGTYAFTDDPKAIPERYRAKVETRFMDGLDGYERYTPAVSSAPPERAKAVAASTTAPNTSANHPAAKTSRIEYLRALNAPQHEPRGHDRGETRTLMIPTGGDDSPSIGVTTRDDDEPVIIETIRTHPEGLMVTRSDLVVRQGDQVITIIKPQANQTNTTSDIIPEEDLLER
jgi:hypothetical protein